MELFAQTAETLGRMLRRRECSAMEIAAAAFSRIRACEPDLHAYITVTEAAALEQAAKVDKELAAGGKLPPLAGIPVGVKDNLCTKGVRTTCASRMLAEFVPPYDATVCEKLADAGAVVTGKTNMDEFAMGSSSRSSIYGPTKNPLDLARVPGGSSGGSAAAVASGEAVLALGSDTGGSVRQPAAYCGVVGLKPTYGSVSRYGLIAFASSLDQVGMLARSVRDAALLFEAVAGRDGRDATSMEMAASALAAGLGQPVEGLRIGIPSAYFEGSAAPDVAERVMEAAHTLEKAGARLVPVTLSSAHDALAAYYVLSSAEASSNLARYDGVRYGYRATDCENLQSLYERSRSEGFGDEVKRRILLGTFVLSAGSREAYYLRAQRAGQRIAREFDEVFARCDCILTPTAPETAFGMDEKLESPLDLYVSDCYTVAANLAGLPALSVPCGFGANRMPVGMQLVGPRFSERALLGAAAWYETLCGPFPMPALGEWGKRHGV